MWSRNTVRESLHMSFFCGGDPLCELERWPENIHGGADSAWVTSGSLSSVQNYRPYIMFLLPCRNINMPLCPRIFLFMAGYRNLHTSVFFPVICWSYLQTDISVTLSTSNKLHSWPSSFIFLFPVKPLCWCYLAIGVNLLSSSKALC